MFKKSQLITIAKKTIVRLTLAMAILVTVSLSMTTRAQDFPIEHVEPNFWWIGMQSNALQLMVHGKNISQLTPKIAYAGVSIEKVHKADSPHYVFIDLIINEQVKAGTFQIDFYQKNNKVTTVNYSLHARKDKRAADTSYSAKDVIYLITPDRFANGDPKNDSVPSMLEPLNRKAVGGRHGGDLQGIINQLDYIADMGFTQLWLMPVVENNQESYSYHGYSSTNFYQIDPRFGNNDTYRQLSEKAQQKGIGLIIDLVLNHAGSGHWWMNDLPMNDWLNFQNQPYVGTHHKRQALHDPHAVQKDKTLFNDGWFVPTMPDLNQRNPFMATYLIQNAIWWVEYADLSGIRVDTYSYPDRDFLRTWTKRLTEEYPHINIVGEEWTTNPAIVSYWQRGKQNTDGYVSYLPSLMDFPLQDALSKSLTMEDSWNSGLNTLYESLANDFLYPNPENLVVFPDNHDMSRIYTQLNHDQDLLKIALTYFLTTRGIPQLFYGTEIAMKNPGTSDHGVIRCDFPGGWAGDTINAFTGKNLTAEQQDIQTFTKQLLNWRKNADAIHHGELKHYSPDAGIYVYFRVSDKQTLMIVINKDNDEKAIQPSHYEELIGEAKTASNVLTNAQFNLNSPIDIPAKSAVIFELN